MKNCYGHYRTGKDSDCRRCEMLKWCINAGDTELLTDRMCSFNEALQDVELQMFTEETHSARQRKLNGEKLEYSRNDLLEVIVYMLNLDKLALELLAEKIKSPEISLSDIARKRNTSRQAVQQALRRKCRENPEIARLLANHERKSRQKKQLTFMEAVCQIRRQNSPMNSNAPKTGSKYYRSLNSWNQNFDLSRMSIFKGSSILTQD
jgi:predicted DNA-binding protein YlxM (UPF0122 family)